MSEITVRLGDLREGAGKFGKMKRVRGARSHIPTTTLLCRDSVGLRVATPQLETGVEGEGRWGRTVAVDCREFCDRLEQIAKLWKDVGGDDARVILSYDEGKLTFAWSDGKSRRTVSMKASFAPGLD